MRNLFKKFMLGFITSLKKEHGFVIAVEDIVNLFRVCGEYDFTDEEEAKNVLSSILCSSQEELHVFSDAFYSYFKKAKEAAYLDVEMYYFEDMMNSYLSEKEELEVKAMKDNAEFANDLLGLEQVDEKTKEELFEISSKVSIDNIILYNVLIKDGAQLYQICKLEDSERMNIVCKIEQEVQEAIIYAIDNNKSDLIISAILDAFEIFEKYITEYSSLQKSQKESKDNITREINKISSKKHRDIYIEGHNAVKAETGYLFKDLSKLNEKDLEKINGYIKRNAALTKTRLKKAVKKKKQNKLDYKKTMKNAVKTDMNPMTLFYKKQKKEKIKIICITDISGSCKNASQVLMTFVYALQEAFPGGVESFVFVKELKETTQIFNTYSIVEANTKTSELVERTYSNYESAFRQFDEEYFDRITKDTIVIYLGDARNNKNATGEEYLSKIKNKVKKGKGKTYWLNPEQSNKWDSGDSIMSIYSKHMDKTLEIKNTNDIICFLNTMF